MTNLNDRIAALESAIMDSWVQSSEDVGLYCVFCGSEVSSTYYGFKCEHWKECIVLTIRQ